MNGSFWLLVSGVLFGGPLLFGLVLLAFRSRRWSSPVQKRRAAAAFTLYLLILNGSILLGFGLFQAATTIIRGPIGYVVGGVLTVGYFVLFRNRLFIFAALKLNSWVNSGGIPQP